jgi:ADP-ribose pyrophosphatase
VYDSIDRRALDAVVMLAHFKKGRTRHIFLRSAIRPPLLSRKQRRGRMEGTIVEGGLWELPAGLVEPSEQGPGGPKRSAQRELAEELGLFVALKALRKLGPAVFPAPAVLAEQHLYFEAEVDPTTQQEPSLDGSALEHQGKVIQVPLAHALSWCARGSIRDAKTELGLRRLWERYDG